MFSITVIGTEMHAISFKPPSRYLFNDTLNDAIEPLPNFLDGSPDSCDDVSEYEFINIRLNISDATNIIQSRVTIKGSQQCHESNMVWFVSGRVPSSIVVSCTVIEEGDIEQRMCNLQCQCTCEDDCGFLHFGVQNPPWLKQTLSLCHYEQYVNTPWNE